MTTTSAPRTRRNERGSFADSGAVKAADGKLPIYDCLGCGDEVCWATSARTGRKYLVNTRRYADHVNGGSGLGRWYDKSSPHRCGERAERDARWSAAKAEAEAAEARLAMLRNLREVAAIIMEVGGWDKVRAYLTHTLAGEGASAAEWRNEFGTDRTVDAIVDYLFREGLREGLR